MRPGEIIAERFEVAAVAGGGGMGQVYRGLDRLTGEPVAVKVLHGNSGAHLERFAREARALSGLSDPRIVRYVAHGSAAGEPYLVMEWLDGEDLARRLSRGPPTIEQSVELARQVAEALRAAHGRGIVHRDLKPSNIFLVDGRFDRVKLLDFGVAQLDSAAALTRTGAIVGTPGYVAPERLLDGLPADARADVFSLGCVLFECLTGQAPFAAEHPLASLARVMLAEPPRPRELRPQLSEALDRLVLQMLAKRPAERVPDGEAVLTALARLELPRAGSEPAAAALTRGERRTRCVVLIGDGDRALDERTLEPGEADTEGALRRAVEAWGGRLWPLRDGHVAVTLEERGPATDQAARAARCALASREHARGRPIALATGLDDAIDRAVRLLATGCDGVALDETSAHLLDGRFDVRADRQTLRLYGERQTFDGTRLLLNRPTPCVGRDRELANLDELFAECVEEPRPHAAVVTGPAGMGKSRLAQEFLGRLRRRGDPFALWIARGDPLRAGSALGLLGQALRGACGIRGDESLVERRVKLLARIERGVPPDDRRRVGEFLGELIGAPFADDDSAPLRAARRNAQVMTDELRRAWIELLRAETRAQPVLLVLEDLHWGDAATVRFVDAALRDVGDRPWMVLALARPEVHEHFPRLWAERSVHEVALGRLGRRAGERLIRHALGDEVGAGTVDRLLALADGNAFYLEELIRAAAERRDESWPETVIAMVQSRLGALGEEERRALRAAAIFGGAFWPGGVAALLGGAGVRERLLSLVDREVLVRRGESRFAGELELSFRHVLLREGAYATLTPDDRGTGHALAGEWLEQAGESDAKLLAEHFDRGGQRARAAAYYLRAAEQALEGGDYDSAARLSGRGREQASEPEVVAGLRAVEVDVGFWTGDFHGAVRRARELLPLARPGSRVEARALSSGIMAAFYLHDVATIDDMATRLLAVEPQPDAVGLLATAFFSVIVSALLIARRDQAAMYLHRLERLAATTGGRDPGFMAWVELSRAMWTLHVERDVWGMFVHSSEALRLHRASGVGGYFPYAEGFAASAHGFLGQFERAEAGMSRVLAILPETGVEALFTRLHLALLYLDQRRPAAAIAISTDVIRDAEARGEFYLRLEGRLYLLEAYLQQGDLAAAEAEAHVVRADAQAQPYIGMMYDALLAQLHLARGRPAEAVAAAERGYSWAQLRGMGFCGRHALLLLVRAESHAALGERDRAAAAIAEAREDLLRRAAKIPELDVRRRFLDIHDHRRTLELARDWLG